MGLIAVEENILGNDLRTSVDSININHLLGFINGGKPPIYTSESVSQAQINHIPL